MSQMGLETEIGSEELQLGAKRTNSEKNQMTKLIRDMGTSVEW